MTTNFRIDAGMTQEQALKVVGMMQIGIHIYNEDMSPFDHFEDKEDAKAVLKDLDGGNEWAWCTVEVYATYRELTHSVYLGACNYKDEAQFRKDGYFADMKEEAIQGILAQVNAIIKDIQTV